MSNPINIGDIGITKEYLSFNEIIKNRIKQSILDNAFSNIFTETSIHRKKVILNKILDNSIKHLEDSEEYEQCSILKEIKDYLIQYTPQNVNKQKNK